jgi:hypothetical protein
MSSMTELARLESGQPIPSESEPVATYGAGYATFGSLLGHLMSSGTATLPGWWSRGRDIRLRQMYKECDQLGGAVYAMMAKMVAIPFHITPRDTNIKLHMQQAEQIERNLRENSNLMRGWEDAYSQYIVDLLTQDNGPFCVILGNGPMTGPIVGPPLGIVHLDAAHCIRTRDPLYPVIYEHRRGSLHKLHYTRVITTPDMPSSDREMNRVGVCAVSRAVQSVQRLIDISRYSQEKLGSRPLRGILTVKGMNRDTLIEAIKEFEMDMSQRGYGYFAKVLALAILDGTLDVNLIDLASLPDGFDEQTTTTLAMYSIALAFGVDARELWPATASGATKADATIQHQKARGKAPGRIMRMVEHQMNFKYLPRHLKFEFDFQDDEQDLMRAQIHAQRAKGRLDDSKVGVIDDRAYLEDMLRSGEIGQSDFNRIELSNGRLPDGTNVLALFFSYDKTFRAWLRTPARNPLLAHENNATEMVTAIDRQEIEVNTIIVNTSDETTKIKAQQALAALTQLRAIYQPGGSPLEGMVPMIIDASSPEEETEEEVNTSEEEENDDDRTAAD